MSLLDFKSITGELAKHGEFKTINVLVRPSKWSGRNQVPAVLMLTKEVLFYGGCVATKWKYHRIPFKSINSVKVVGWGFMKCVEVNYLASEGDRKIFFCPFTGALHQPSIDEERLHELHDLLKGALE